MQKTSSSRSVKRSVSHVDATRKEKPLLLIVDHDGMSSVYAEMGRRAGFRTHIERSVDSAVSFATKTTDIAAVVVNDQLPISAAQRESFDEFSDRKDRLNDRIYGAADLYGVLCIGRQDRELAEDNLARAHDILENVVSDDGAAKFLTQMRDDKVRAFPFKRVVVINEGPRKNVPSAESYLHEVGKFCPFVQCNSKFDDRKTIDDTLQKWGKQLTPARAL